MFDMVLPILVPIIVIGLRILFFILVKKGKISLTNEGFDYLIFFDVVAAVICCCVFYRLRNIMFMIELAVCWFLPAMIGAGLREVSTEPHDLRDMP